MATSLILFSALLALSSAALDESPEIDNPFIALPLCQSGWSPLGTDYQPLALFPYQLKCTPSADGKSVKMSITADPERGFAHAIVAPTSESGEVFANGKYDFVKADNYRPLTCNPSEEERASILVKVDSAPQTEMEISWELPDGVKVDDVHCRFFVAEGIKTYWQDIQVPAKPSSNPQTSRESVDTTAPDTVGQTESESEVETAGDKTAEAGIPKTPADPNPQTQPTATESEVEASGDETETTNPETVVLETEVEGQAVDEAGSGDEEITAAETRVGATGGESVVETDSDKGQEEKEEDFVRDAQGRQILTEKAELKFSFGGEDQASSYYCESGGTMLVLKRGSSCETFYMATESSSKIAGEFNCGPGTSFNANICACDFKNNMVCPDSVN